MDGLAFVLRVLIKIVQAFFMLCGVIGVMISVNQGIKPIPTGHILFIMLLFFVALFDFEKTIED